MEISKKRGLGLLSILLIMAVGIFLLDMPLLAFIFSLLVLMFSLTED